MRIYKFALGVGFLAMVSCSESEKIQPTSDEAGELSQFAKLSPELLKEFPLFPSVEPMWWQNLLEAEKLANDPQAEMDVRAQARQKAEKIAAQLRAEFPFENNRTHVRLGAIVFEKESRQFAIPARVNYPRKNDERHPRELELVLCTPHGRSHETLFVTDARPLHLELALLLAGFEKHSKKSRFRVEVVHSSSERLPLHSLIRSKQGDQLPKPLTLEFSGSEINGVYPPDQTGDFIICWHAHDAILRVIDDGIASGQTKLDAFMPSELEQGQEVTLILTPIN